MGDIERDQVPATLISKAISVTKSIQTRLIKDHRHDQQLCNDKNKPYNVVGHCCTVSMDMSSLTYAICNQEEFLHLADTDTHHQIRVSSAVFRAYAIIHKVVLCQYDL